MLIQISWLDQYTVRITCCGHQSNNPVIISSGPTGKTCIRRTRLWECLGIRTRIYASRDAGFCVPEKPKFITGCSECLSFPHCQYTASLDLDTFQEIFRAAIIGNYDCEKGTCILITAHVNIEMPFCGKLNSHDQNVRIYFIYKFAIAFKRALISFD